MSDPSTKSAAFAAMTTTFFKVDALAGGTDTMRAAGKLLLPKHPDEEEVNYAKRLSTSTLVNFYGEAIDAAVGRAFKAPVKVENFGGALAPLLTDIDGAGNTLDQFGQEQFWHKIHHGVTYAAVDFPTLEVKPRTLADVKRLAARPYAYLIAAPSVLGAYSKFENGCERLVHFRWLTSRIEPAEDHLSETVVAVVKAYNQPDAYGPITLTTWEKRDSGWVQLEPLLIEGVSTIPVVCDYGWRTGFYLGKPVLGSLAELNIAHWQSRSEQTNILSVVRVPFLHAALEHANKQRPAPNGRTVSEEFKLTPHKATITGKDDKIQWVEASGSSIEQGFKDIDWLEAKMSMMTLTPSTSKTGNVTATETAITAAEASAKLTALAVSTGQALSKVLFLLSEFAGSPAPTVKVSLDASFEVDAAPPPNAEKPKQETAPAN